MKRKRKHSWIFGDESFKKELSEDQNCTTGRWRGQSEYRHYTKMKFSIKDFFSRYFLQI